MMRKKNVGFLFFQSSLGGALQARPSEQLVDSDRPDHHLHVGCSGGAGDHYKSGGKPRWSPPGAGDRGWRIFTQSMVTRDMGNHLSDVQS